MGRTAGAQGDRLTDTYGMNMSNTTLLDDSDHSHHTNPAHQVETMHAATLENHYHGISRVSMSIYVAPDSTLTFEHMIGP